MLTVDLPVDVVLDHIVQLRNPKPEKPRPGYYRVVFMPQVEKDKYPLNEFNLDLYALIEVKILYTQEALAKSSRPLEGPQSHYMHLDECLVNILEWKKYDGETLSGVETELLHVARKSIRDRDKAERAAGEDL